MKLEIEKFNQGKWVLPDILEKCEQAQIRTFLQSCRLTQFDKQETILHSEDAPADVCFLVKGRAKVVQFSQAGKEIWFASLKAGSSFGVLSALDQQPRSADVLSETECDVLRVDGDLFRQFLMATPEVSLQLMQQLSMTVRQLDKQVVGLSTLTSKYRIRQRLREIASEYPCQNEVASLPNLPTGEYLASQVACAREVVSREMSRLKREGVIWQEDGNYRISLNDIQNSE